MKGSEGQFSSAEPNVNSGHQWDQCMMISVWKPFFAAWNYLLTENTQELPVETQGRLSRNGMCQVEQFEVHPAREKCFRLATYFATWTLLLQLSGDAGDSTSCASCSHQHVYFSCLKMRDRRQLWNLPQNDGLKTHLNLSMDFNKNGQDKDLWFPRAVLRPPCSIPIYFNNGFEMSIQWPGKTPICCTADRARGGPYSWHL